MPGLTVWMLRLSLLALAGGAGAGAVRLADWSLGSGHPAQLRALHLDLMLFGWLLQFVLGVAYWILPRHAAEPVRGSPGHGWLAFWLFQTGLSLALAGDLWHPGTAPVGRVLLVGATFGYLLLLLPRIKPFGRP